MQKGSIASEVGLQGVDPAAERVLKLWLLRLV
jgi:hypothetical protein